MLFTTTSPVRYTPPGYLLYLQGDSLLAQQFDAKREALVGDARTLVNSVSGFSVSDNGVLAFRPGSVNSPKRLTWFDRKGNITGTIGEVADYSNPALSRDEGRLC